MPEITIRATEATMSTVKRVRREGTGVVTVKTTAAHGFLPGDRVVIDTASHATFDGEFVIIETSESDPGDSGVDQFTYYQDAIAATSASDAGTAVVHRTVVLPNWQIIETGDEEIDVTLGQAEYDQLDREGFTGTPAFFADVEP